MDFARKHYERIWSLIKEERAKSSPDKRKISNLKMISLGFLGGMSTSNLLNKYKKRGQ